MNWNGNGMVNHLNGNNQMICKKCKIKMKHVTGSQNGGYHICIECNNVVITGETSNEKVGK